MIENGVDTDVPSGRGSEARRAQSLEIGDQIRSHSSSVRSGAARALRSRSRRLSSRLLAPARRRDGDANEAIHEPRPRRRASLHFVTETPEPERYYAAADAFVLPSAYESFSLAAFEAAAAGLPVLATDVGAVGEIVNGGGGSSSSGTPSRSATR